MTISQPCTVKALRVLGLVRSLAPTLSSFGIYTETQVLRSSESDTEPVEIASGGTKAVQALRGVAVCARVCVCVFAVSFGD